MSLRQTFRINTPTVVSEAFDDEIVVIHLECGTYYSLAQSGAAIWKLLQQGVALSEISSQLGAAYRVSPDEVADTVSPFIKELTQEQLIVPTGASPQSTNGVLHTNLAHPVDSVSSPFPPPILHKFTDMQDLLLLDPIHEVDSRGWPTRK